MDPIICCVINRFAAEELETMTRKGLFREIKKCFDIAFPPDFFTWEVRNQDSLEPWEFRKVLRGDAHKHENN